MAYLCNLYIVIDEEMDVTDNRINGFIDQIMDLDLSDNDLSTCIVGANICELNKTICGKCCKCGAWVSDQQNVDSIDGFSDGCCIDGKWWCYLCLQENHPKHF